jgi:TonB family protein
MRLSITHFIATSVLAHAAIFVAGAGTQSHTLLIPSTSSSAPAFEVSLQSTTVTARPSHVVTSRRQHSKPKPLHQQQPAKAKSPEPVQETATPPAATAAATPYQAELRRTEVRDRVLSKIRRNLQQYFVYPLLAQRQGWQGQVMLGFSVEANGMIRNIHIAAGSGYPILDTSAVNALSRVQHLFEASDWLRGRRLELQMPVIFQLQGG